MRKAILPLALALSVFDPMVACDDPLRERDFEYGAAEMRGVIEGTWMVVAQRPNRPAEHYTIVIRQAGDAQQEHAERTFVRSASACTTRKLIREAGACVDLTRMPLDMRVASGPATAAHGEFDVMGTTFWGGRLDMQVGDLDIMVDISKDGLVHEVWGRHDGDPTFTLIKAKS